MCGGNRRDVLQRVSTFAVVAKNNYFCGSKKFFLPIRKKNVSLRKISLRNFSQL